MKNSSNKKVTNTTYSWYYVIPIATIILIVPLLVRLKVILLTGASFDYWKGETQNSDIFSYNKMVWLLICTAITIAFLIYAYIKNKNRAFKSTKYYIPMIIYAVFILLSTVFSKYKSISLYGFVDRYEGILVLLAYLILMFAAINFVNSRKDINIVLHALFISAVVIGIIGFFQYFNMDIFQTDLGKNLILPAKYKSEIGSFSFNLGPRAVYSTLYHYNYVGSFMAMLFPLTLTIFLFAKDKKYKVIMGIIALLMFSTLIMSKSRAGLIGACLACVILLLMCRKYVLIHKKLIIPFVGVLIIVFIGINISTGGVIVNRIQGLFKDVEDLQNNSVAQEQSDIKNIQIKDGRVIITTLNGELNIYCLKSNNNTIQFKDEKGKIINTVATNTKGNYIFSDSRYKDYSFIYGLVNNIPVLVLNKGNAVSFYFGVDKGEFRYSSPTGVFYENKKIEHFGFEGKEKLASARAYIWSRSFPLLKNTLLLGHGPDTFAIYFPQQDFIGKLKAYGYVPIVDKPHNLYLQTAINTGVISLLAELAIFIIYIVSCFKLYFKGEFNNTTSAIGLGIFLAVIGYLGAAFLNDSVVGVAPVFWILLGTGISLNLKQKNNEEVL